MKTCKKLHDVKDCKSPAEVLSDHDVELMRVMHEEHPRGHAEHIGYRKLAAIFGCSPSMARHICLYRKRVKGL